MFSSLAVLCLETFCLWAQGNLREGWRKSVQQKQCVCVVGGGLFLAAWPFEEGPWQAGAVPPRLSKLAQSPPQGKAGAGHGCPERHVGTDHCASDPRLQWLLWWLSSTELQ